MSDLKDDIQKIADLLAFERHGREFYDLTPAIQGPIYAQAIEDYVNRAADRADYLNDAKGETCV
jgi:hypothetical protein